MKDNEKFWAVSHLVCIGLLAVGIPLAIVFGKQEILPLIIVFSALAGIGFLGMITTFLKMYQVYGSDMVELCIIFFKYWFTLLGGCGIWGIVVAIKILTGKF